MPIYSYRCAACGHAKDVLQKISDTPLTDCPACGAPRFEKQVTAAGFQLKGSGWYVTDFRDGAKKKSDKTDKGDKAGDTTREPAPAPTGDKTAAPPAAAPGGEPAGGSSSASAASPAAASVPPPATPPAASS